MENAPLAVEFQAFIDTEGGIKPHRSCRDIGRDGLPHKGQHLAAHGLLHREVFGGSVGEGQLQRPAVQAHRPHIPEENGRLRLPQPVLVLHPVGQDVYGAAIRDKGGKVDPPGQELLFPPGQVGRDGFPDKGQHLLPQLLPHGKGLGATVKEQEIQRSPRGVYRFDLLVGNNIALPGFGLKLRLPDGKVQHPVVQKPLAAGEGVPHPLGQKLFPPLGKVGPHRLFDVQKRLVDALAVHRAAFGASVLGDKVDGFQPSLFNRHQAGVVKDGLLDAAGHILGSVAVDHQLPCWPEGPLYLRLVDQPARPGVSARHPFAAMGAEGGPLHHGIPAFGTHQRHAIIKLPSQKACGISRRSGCRALRDTPPPGSPDTPPGRVLPAGRKKPPPQHRWPAGRACKGSRQAFPALPQAPAIPRVSGNRTGR